MSTDSKKPSGLEDIRPDLKDYVPIPTKAQTWQQFADEELSKRNVSLDEFKRSYLFSSPEWKKYRDLLDANSSSDGKDGESAPPEASDSKSDAQGDVPQPSSSKEDDVPSGHPAKPITPVKDSDSLPPVTLPEVAVPKFEKKASDAIINPDGPSLSAADVAPAQLRLFKGFDPYFKRIDSLSTRSDSYQ